MAPHHVWAMLKNVYFVFLLELRALMKVGPYLQKELFYTGNEKGVESHARELREEFRSHFLNISRIMDCVGCDKCRLWGK
ncbi:unnamed protein product, partial [Strongylus vulgaris]